MGVCILMFGCSMKPGAQYKTRTHGGAALALAALLVLACAVPAWAADLVVVVNANAPVEDLSVGDVRDIYLGEKTYWEGVRIVPVGYMDGSPRQTEFLERVLAITENRFKTHWIKRIFREGGVPPRKAVTPDEAASLILRTPGGIGFFRAGEVENRTGLKVVFRVSG